MLLLLLHWGEVLLLLLLHQQRVRAYGRIVVLLLGGRTVLLLSHHPWTTHRSAHRPSSGHRTLELLGVLLIVLLRCLQELRLLLRIIADGGRCRGRQGGGGLGAGEGRCGVDREGNVGPMTHK